MYKPVMALKIAGCECKKVYCKIMGPPGAVRFYHLAGATTSIPDVS
jgi:hypothetical protein